MAWRRLASGTAATHLRRGVSSPPFAAPSRAFSAANPTRLLKAFGTGGSAIAVMIYPREVAQAAVGAASAQLVQSGRTSSNPVL
nr:uncharacterized protein LOC127314848 isoform X6 [Lolium perenne]